RFPVVFAERTRALGVPVVCVGIKHEAPPELIGLCDRFYWAGIARLGRMIRCFRREGVRRAVMAGKVHKGTFMHRPLRWLSLMPDGRMLQSWSSRQRRDNRDDSLLLALIAEFAKDGIQFDSALDLCPELLVKPGVLTRRPPTAREEADIAFGW